jgi:hypothetical protein
VRKVGTLLGSLLVTTLLVVGTTSAGAQTTPGQSTAVITPTLRIIGFGNAIGFPLVCDLTSSVLPALSASLTSVANEVANTCQTVSTKGGPYIQEGIAASGSASAINPLIDPLLAALAGQLTDSAQSYPTQLGPFGPTVAGLGQTISFFEGSSS